MKRSVGLEQDKKKITIDANIVSVTYVHYMAGVERTNGMTRSKVGPVLLLAD